MQMWTSNDAEYLLSKAKDNWLGLCFFFLSFRCLTASRWYALRELYGWAALFHQPGFLINAAAMQLALWPLLPSIPTCGPAFTLLSAGRTYTKSSCRTLSSPHGHLIYLIYPCKSVAEWIQHLFFFSNAYLSCMLQVAKSVWEPTDRKITRGSAYWRHARAHRKTNR